MAKRRGRRRGTWFPNLGTSGPEDNLTDDSAGVWAEILTNTNGTSSVFITDLTFDQPVDEGADSAGTNPRSLADFIGSEYILKRIVGKLFVGLDQSQEATSTGAVLVTAGFFIARADDDDTLVNPSPIGAGSPSEQLREYGPDSVGNIREPWIWRRQWILGNTLRTFTNSASGEKFFPPNNVTYAPGGMDGPHIDAKTIRRCGTDDRLWFVTQVRPLGSNWADPFGSVDVVLALHVKVHLDYRLFGTLMKAKGKGSF